MSYENNSVIWWLHFTMMTVPFHIASYEVLWELLSFIEKNLCEQDNNNEITLMSMSSIIVLNVDINKSNSELIV